MTGTYTIWMQHDLTYSGSDTLQLLSNSTVNLTINSVAQTVSFSSAHLDAALNFVATSAQGVTIHITQTTSQSPTPVTLQVLTADGGPVGGSISGTTLNWQINLPSSGEYTIVLIPDHTGTINLRLTSP